MQAPLFLEIREVKKIDRLVIANTWTAILMQEPEPFRAQRGLVTSVATESPEVSKDARHCRVRSEALPMEGAVIGMLTTLCMPPSARISCVPAGRSSTGPVGA